MALHRMRGNPNYYADDRGLRELGNSDALRGEVLEATRSITRSVQNASGVPNGWRVTLTTTAQGYAGDRRPEGRITLPEGANPRRLRTAVNMVLRNMEAWTR